MELKNNKFLISTIIVALVVLVSYNFDITGQATTEMPTRVKITSGISGGTIYSRTNVKLLLENSRPNQRIELDRADGTATRYYLEAKKCEPMGARSSREYRCTASQYLGTGDLKNGQRYCFQAKDRYGNNEGKPQACFTYREK